MEKITFRTTEEAKQLTLPYPSSKTLEICKSTIAFVKYENASRASKTKRIYSAIDSVMSDIASFSVCQKGCSHCCKIDVSILDIEAAYIERNTGRSAKVHGPQTGGYSQRRTPCTFLGADGDCTIYAVRPFSCRTYLAFDSPVFCESGDLDHATYDLNGSNLLKDLAILLLELSSQGQWKDIRDFFPTVKSSELISET